MSFLPGVDGRAATEFTFIPVSLNNKRVKALLIDYG